MKRHVVQALSCTAAAFALAVGALFLLIGPPGSNAGEAVGRLIALIGIAGLLCGWTASRSKQPWSWPKFAGIYVLFCVGVLVVSAYGNNTQSHAAAKPGPGFSVNWPKGWTVQHLEGVSSAPEDHDLGSRERGLRGDVKAPSAVIEVTCLHKPEREVKNADQLDGILSGMVKGYEAQGFEVSRSAPTPTRVGSNEALSAELRAVRGEDELAQSFTVAQNANCLLTLTLTAKKSEFDANQKAYADVKASVK